MNNDQFFAKLLLLLSVFPLAAVAAECPQTAKPPVQQEGDLSFVADWKDVAAPFRSRDTVADDQEPDYGVGYLRLTNVDQYYYDWPKAVQLPLWHTPLESEFAGWLHSGRVYIDDQPPYPLSGAGMLETGYEANSFIVYQATGNGWLQVRLKPGKNGMAWTHQCHLQSGSAKLVYEDWQHFLIENGDWLHFRQRVPHRLRLLASVDSALVTTIGLDHKLVLKEISGDWMRVSVEQPDWSCGGGPLEQQAKSVHEGWVQWRDDQQGPWVWVYTRGC